MPHIELPEGLPGILGPLMQYPDTAKPLNEFTQALLRGPSPLSPGERELIAAFVSKRNGCAFCNQAHAATARHLLGAHGADTVEMACETPEAAGISEKMKALLQIAGQVQQGGKQVTSEAIARARAAGCDDRAIHDTVLVAAAFCMFNRYVDGLATWTPEGTELYDQIGAGLAANGYLAEV